MKTVLSGVIIVVAIGAVIWLTGSKVANAPTPAPETAEEKSMQQLTLTSSAFAHNAMMPEGFTCDGSDTVPPLEIGNIPTGTKTLALVMHDPDAPRAGGWTHWVRYNVLWNMEHEIWNIKEGKEPEGVSGKGTGGELTYQGPCPPSGTHHYVFTVYALDTELTLKAGATKTELESAMQGHILGTGELIGLYSRKRK